MCPAWPDNVDFGWTDNVGRYNLPGMESIELAIRNRTSSAAGLRQADEGTG